MNFVEWEDDEGVDYGPDSRDEEEYESDEKRAFVVRGMMSTPKYDEQTEHHELFRTRCTIMGEILGRSLIMEAAKISLALR